MKNEVTKLYSAQLVLKAQWKPVGWPQRLTCFNLIQHHPTTYNCYLNSTQHSIKRDHICCYSIIKYYRALDLR